MAYSAWSVIAGEQPTAAKWNILGTNDASFNDGTGIGTSTITTSKLSLTKSTDANGWIVYDFNTWKEYRKRLTFSQTIAGLAVLTTSSSNLPVGISTISTNFITYTFTATSNAGTLQIVIEGSSASSALQFTSATTDTVSRAYVGFIDVIIVSP